MKIIAKRRLYNDLLIFAGFVCLIIITPPISLKNPSTIMSFISILFLLIFEILPHLRVIELTQDRCIVHWFGIKKIYRWEELEKIIYSSIKVSRLEKLEGLFFFSDMMGKNKNSISPMRVYVSLSIFKQFYIIFDNEVQKKQIMQLLKEWGIEVTLDEKLVKQREYERSVAEKTQMREERKKLYEESKKSKWKKCYCSGVNWT